MRSITDSNFGESIKPLIPVTLSSRKRVAGPKALKTIQSFL